MGGTVVLTRWQRYGKDRLYAKDSDGVPVGWLDLRTGIELHERESKWTGAVAAAINDWLDRHPDIRARMNGQPVEPPQPDEPPRAAESPPAAERSSEWVDLAPEQPEARVHELDTHRESLWDKVSRLASERVDLSFLRPDVRTERAEQKTIRRLEEQGWRTLQGVPLGDFGGEAENVLFGPAGVFVATTKRLQGARVDVASSAVYVNGEETDLAREARRPARRTGKLLSAATGRKISVEPLLLFEGARVNGVRCKGVTVVEWRRLLVHMVVRGRLLADREVDDMFAVARRSTTWEPTRQTA